MLVDNLGWGDLSCYIGPTRGVTTPRLDKFASEGLRLTNFMVEAACTSSRSALMTRYAAASQRWFTLSQEASSAYETNRELVSLRG
jgi:arylsulfatase A-like enzyme